MSQMAFNSPAEETVLLLSDLSTIDLYVYFFPISPMKTAFSFDSEIIKSCCESVLTDDLREISDNSSSEEL